jgi:endonuclease/exonuclease/phosphatase family metal-dependent hydrolase
VEVKLFNVVIDHNVRNTSDHIPIYADIALN